MKKYLVYLILVFFIFSCDNNELLYNKVSELEQKIVILENENIHLKNELIEIRREIKESLIEEKKPIIPKKDKAEGLTKYADFLIRADGIYNEQCTGRRTPLANTKCRTDARKIYVLAKKIAIEYKINYSEAEKGIQKCASINSENKVSNESLKRIQEAYRDK